MNKSAILKRYGYISEDLEDQYDVIKQEVGKIVSKNIKEIKTNEESFYSNKKDAIKSIERLKDTLLEKKHSFEENNISNDTVFLFSEASQKETYNRQLQILKSASDGLKTVQTIKHHAESEGTFIKNRRKEISEFNFLVKIKDVKKLKDISKILEDIFKLDIEYYVKYDNISIENVKSAKDDLMSMQRKVLEQIQKFPQEQEIAVFASFMRNTRYSYCQSLSEIFNKYDIENCIHSTNVDELFENNKVVNANFTQCSKIENDAQKSIRKRYGVKKFFRKLFLFLAIALACVCVMGGDAIEKLITQNVFLSQYEDVILSAMYPALIANIIMMIILRCHINTEKKLELSKCQKYCDELCTEYFKKFHKLQSELSGEYYELCKNDYFEKSEQMIQEMSQFKVYLEEEAEKVKQLLVTCFTNSMPNGLLERERLLDTIIRVMEQGRATEYKEARVIAEGILENERIRRQQTEYLTDKARKDEEHRRAVMDSQLRMEKHAEEQAEAARRSAEAASRAAEAQEKAASYAKDTAESSQKLLDLEEKKYWEDFNKG